ncbi:MAG TPA: rhomboid family intramembrane serine protease [Casimicrobiaceae bacterium]|nr:rhomboid family intramembrane serine protease [Casimicrobiaceae bacterium]
MPPVTLALVTANVAIFLLQMAAPAIVVPFALWPLGSARIGGSQVGFEPWQLVTYAFLHGGLLHLGFNMFALYMFGGPIEQVFGGRRYTFYYFVCVVSAAIAQLAVSALTGTVYPAIGASGGVFGVLLAYAIYFPRNRIMLIFPPIPMPARVFVLVYAALELFFGVTGTQEGVAHFAHLGGLVGGFIVLQYWRGTGRLRR